MNFDLRGAGSVSSSGGSPLGYGITALSNGWYRVWMAVTASSAATANTGIIPISTGLEARKPTITYLGSETFYTYGAQLELGAYPTSYIPTTTAAATRAADLCSSGVSWLNTAEGTMVVEATSGGFSTAAASGPRVVSVADGTSSSYHDLRRAAYTRTASGFTQTAGTGQAFMNSDVWADYTTARIALAWKNNDEATCFAGGTVATDNDTPGGMPTGMTILWLGTLHATVGFFNGYLRNLRCWGRRLSNEQLKAMTS